MAAALVLGDESVDDLDAFAAALEAVGLTAWDSTLRAARAFHGRVERAGGLRVAGHLLWPTRLLACDGTRDNCTIRIGDCGVVSEASSAICGDCSTGRDLGEDAVDADEVGQFAMPLVA